MKKRQILFSAMAAVVLMVTGCAKNEATKTDVDPDGKKGSLSVNFSFDKAPGVLAVQQAVPITSWSNIKSILLVLTTGAGDAEKVADARDIPVSPNAGNVLSKVLEGVNVGTYKLYMIANATEASNAGPYGGSIVNKGLVNDAFWTPGTLKGGKMSDLRFALKEKTTTQGELGGAVAGGKNYDSPQEIFVAQQASVVIAADTDTPVTMKLKRAVSLVRVRINTDVNGADPKFTDATASLGLSRVQLNLSASGLLGNTAVNTTDYILKKGAFKNTNPTSGYSPLTIVEAPSSLWTETIMFPTKNGDFVNDETGAPSASKVFVKLAAKVPANYIFADGTKANEGDVAYWGKNVDVWFHPNQITVINCKLTSRGEGNGEEVVPTMEGNLEVTVQYEDWSSNIQETEVEM